MNLLNQKTGNFLRKYTSHICQSPKTRPKKYMVNINWKTLHAVVDIILLTLQYLHQ